MAFSAIHDTVPVSMSIPMVFLPLLCRARYCVTISYESYPALSANIVGIALYARANASIAYCSLPGILLARSSTASAIIISDAPPPKTVRVFLTVCDSTDNASCIERSASSNAACEPPRRIMVHASPFSTPEKRITRSSPKTISSIKSQ
uniref:Uncharacterized protein n=1 Tax=Lygus hesperus TaxID=30085 RepID=A0A146LD95_LYGHE